MSQEKLKRVSNDLDLCIEAAKLLLQKLEDLSRSLKIASQVISIEKGEFPEKEEEKPLPTLPEKITLSIGDLNSALLQQKAGNQIAIKLEALHYLIEREIGFHAVLREIGRWREKLEKISSPLPPVAAEELSERLKDWRVRLPRS